MHYKLLNALFALVAALTLSAYTSTQAMAGKKNTVTYVYKQGDTEWFRENKVAEEGQPYPDLRALPSGVKYTSIPMGTVKGNETVEIQCEVDKSYDIPFSTSFENARWFYIKTNAGTQSFWSYTSTTKKVDTTPNNFSTAKGKGKYMWAILGNPITGYQIVNKLAGASMILTSASPKNDGSSGGNTFPVMSKLNNIPSGHNTYWSIKQYGSNGYGYLISRDGEDINLNRRGNELAYWTGYDDGSRVGFFPVDEVIDAIDFPFEKGKEYQARNFISGEIITDFTGKTISAGNIEGCYHLSSVKAVVSEPKVFYATKSTTSTSGPVLWSSLSSFSEWYIEEKGASPTDPFKPGTPNYVTSITSGKYYRLYSLMYAGKLLTDKYSSTDGVTGLTALDGTEGASQIWKLVETGSATGAVGRYTLQNVLTGRYIATQNATSAQYPTTDDATKAYSFYVQSDVSGTDTYFTFSQSVNGQGMHLAPHQENKVVRWTSSAEANRWCLDETEVSAEALELCKEFYESQKDVQQIINNASKYATALNTFFDDKACTKLKSTYANYTDEELRTAMSALPHELQEMAVCIKNNKWDENATKSLFIKDFRIHAYDIYSDPDTWASITKVGRFGNLYHPTGIAVKAGQPLFIMVSDNPKDSYAKLEIGITPETRNNPSQTVALKAGLNIIQPTTDGEAFVLYRLTNSNKYLKDYPDITVHIEGGEATGCFDMHRGHTNNDWAYLCSNMFTNKYLHIMGEHTSFCVESERVRGAANIVGSLKVWDFIFMTEEKLIGHDGQWDGRYNPVIVARDQYEGNPNWGGTSANYSGIFKDGLLNYNSLFYGDRWVIYHEEAHGHQYPVNLAATTESSNNGFAQMVNHEFGLTSRRADGTKTLMTFKNDGLTWVDILRGGEGANRGRKYYEESLWLQNHMFYQLYLYFHVQGVMPDFWPRLCDEMRSNGGLIKRSQQSNPTLYYEDYLKFAEAACKVSNTDLYEFFDSYGFFGYCEDVFVGNDLEAFTSKDKPENGVRFVGDYGGYYMRMPMRSNAADVERIENLIKKMKSYPNKAPNIMFIDDHIKDRNVTKDCFAASLEPSVIGQPVGFYDSGTKRQGEMGDFTDFNGKSAAKNIAYTISGTTINMSGSGMVGIKIYDANGKLVAINNNNSFTVSTAIANGLKNGTHTLVAAMGDQTNLPIPAPGTKTYNMTVYNGSADDVQTIQVSGKAVSESIPYFTSESNTDAPALTGNQTAVFAEINAADRPEAMPTRNVFYKDGANWTTSELRLLDTDNFYLPEGTYTSSAVNYIRTNRKGYNTLYLPFAIKASDITEKYGCTVYTFQAIDTAEGTISFVEAAADQAIPANSPMLIYGETNTFWNISATNAVISGSPATADNLIGSFQNKTLGTKCYALDTKSGCFMPTTATSTVTPFRFYLTAPGSNANAFTLTLEDLTGFSDATTDANADVNVIVYNLQGQPVATFKGGDLKAQGLPAGTYIMNNKKVQVR